ncbi:MAG: alpha/beta hydrolase [Aeromicrobium sp.]|uniref:alpha/beta hydrolase n=1 Tax=Aeromicrobium sp. TaxID=1871063 RepID=UPI0039E613D3
MSAWVEDVLGSGYEQRTIELGADPDGEGDIVATLVRATEPVKATHAFVWVHGFTDYFFQTELADFLVERGFAFYALDLHKCGRSRRPGQTPHYVSDLGLYDAEIGRALDLVREESGDLPILLGGHSTGGLVLALWAGRLNSVPGRARKEGIEGLLLDSPWFDLQGAAWLRSVGTQVIRLVAQVQPYRALNLPKSSAYGSSLHVSAHGEWDYNLDWKPIGGFPITYGWINAIRRGHAAFHRGIDVGVPSLVLRSDATYFSRTHRPRTDVSDAVLDVKQIARWAGCLGDAVTSLAIPGALHDVYLSAPAVRAQAYAATDRWLHDFILER